MNGNNLVYFGIEQNYRISYVSCFLRQDKQITKNRKISDYGHLNNIE